MKNRSILFITASFLIVSNIYSQLSSLETPASHETDAGAKRFLPVISRISVLSIHVRDTLVHDSIFHFLKDKLGLSVEYYPVRWNERKYAGVYAGNMFLEPCGPYSNFKYATNDFRSIFFGLNCESERSLSALAEDFDERHIKTEQDGTIQITDTTIIKQNIYFSISSGPIQNKVSEDSLRSVMLKNNENGPGIESIKEIRIGYTDNKCLDKWKSLIKPSVISDACLWQVNEDQSIRFVKSSIREVSAIVFKVQSLEKVKKWLSANKLSGDISKDEIALDKSKTFGLIILFSEEGN
jgi:hypothetical protein